MRFVILSLFIGLSFPLAAFSVEPTKTDVSEACRNDGKRIAYKVNKMHCSNCEESLVKYFSKQPNVVAAHADYKVGCLKIEWRDGKEAMQKADIAAAIKKMGYEYDQTAKQ